MKRNVISFEDHLFGRVAVSLGYISPEQLRECLKTLAGEGGRNSLAQTLFTEGLLDQEKLGAIRKVQHKKRCKHVHAEVQQEEERDLSRALLADGLVEMDDLESCLLEKQKLARKHVQVHLGEVLVNRGVLNEDTVRRILRERRGEIRHCEECDLSFRIGPDVPERDAQCPQCGGKMGSVSYLQLIETDGEVE